MQFLSVIPLITWGSVISTGNLLLLSLVLGVCAAHSRLQMLLALLSWDIKANSDLSPGSSEVKINSTEMCRNQ